MSEELLVERQGAVLSVTFNRPAQRNAMTWTMYKGLYEACERADTEDGVRVMVVQGAGGEAFVAGTDIAQFRSFASGEDGVEYEHQIGRIIARLGQVQVPTVAAVSGPCVGGGLAIASACDLRVATTTARFGVPVARTLGNCLAISTYAMLVEQLGSSRTLDMLLRARLIDVDEARTAGFVCEVCEPESLETVVAELTDRLCSHAPLTIWATKESARRLRLAGLPDGDDIVHAVYDSDDFAEGVAAFVDKRRPDWRGR